MDQLWAKVIGLDLKLIRAKYAAGKSWWWHLLRSPAQIEGEYRQFLFLMASNPEKTLVPWSQDLEDFCRQHSLDATRYAADCNAIAGRLLQHRPHSVKRSPTQLRECEETRCLYLAAFGESARKRRRSAGEIWPGSDTTLVFSDNGVDAPGSRHAHHVGHHGGGYTGASGHHGGGHHHDAGIQAPAHHGDGGLSGGGHGGHSCGGHSGCGGHGH